MDDVRGNLLGPPHGTTTAAVITNEHIKVNSSEGSEIIKKREGWPYCAISDTESSLVTLIKLATEASKFYCDFEHFNRVSLFQRRIRCKKTESKMQTAVYSLGLNINIILKFPE